MVGEALPLLPPLTPRHWCFIIPNFEQLALDRKNRVCPEIFPCIEYTFYIQDFWATCACPEKQSVPWICIEYIFLIIQNFEQICACPEKQSLPWKFSLHWKIFYHLEFWTTCACPEKQSVPWIHCIEYTEYCLLFKILSNLRLPWKTEFALNLLYWIYIFYHTGVFNNLRLPWKTECALNSRYSIYIFYNSESWTTCACPEKQSLPWIRCIDIFYCSEFWTTCACPEKQSWSWTFQAGGDASPHLVRHY